MMNGLEINAKLQDKNQPWDNSFSTPVLVLASD